MKTNLKKCINNFNENIIVYIGITLILLFLVAVSWIVIAGIVASVMSLLQISFNWHVATVIWALCIIILKLYANKIKKELEQNKK